MHATGARIKSGLSNIRPARLKLPQRRDMDRKTGVGGAQPRRMKRGAIRLKRSRIRLSFSPYQAQTSLLTDRALLWWGQETRRNDPFSFTPSDASLMSFNRY